MKCSPCPLCGRCCTGHIRRRITAGVVDAYCTHGLPRMGVHEWTTMWKQPHSSDAESGSAPIGATSEEPSRMETEDARESLVALNSEGEAAPGEAAAPSLGIPTGREKRIGRHAVPEVRQDCKAREAAQQERSRAHAGEPGSASSGVAVWSASRGPALAQTLSADTVEPGSASSSQAQASQTAVDRHLHGARRRRRSPPPGLKHLQRR